MSTTIDALSARVDLLNIVVQELARSLSRKRGPKALLTLAGD